MEKEHHHHICLWPIVVSAVMLVAGLVAGWMDMPWFEGAVALVWYIVAFLPVGAGVMRSAVEHASHGDVFNEFMLMALASIGAFIIGEYPEAVAVMLLYQVARCFSTAPWNVCAAT